MSDWRVVCVISAVAIASATAARSEGTGGVDVVSGKIFLDANGNGALDSGERGLVDVRVTDGVNFVNSGADGSYTLRIADDPTLPARRAQTVGVCWPSGTWPSGPWWQRLSRVKDAGAVHFALRAEEQKAPFLYFHMTDPHEYFNDAHLEFAAFVNALPPDVKFIIDTGDSYRQKSAEEKFNRLFISAVGNHDTWEAPDPPPEGRYGAWTDRLGPLRWSFDHAGVHFVGVDLIEEVKDKAMVDWLEKDLGAVPGGTRIIVSYHYPDRGFGDERLARLLRDPRIRLIQAGHNHAYAWDPGTGGIAPLVTAYHWQPPGNCNVIAVGADRLDLGVYCIGCKKAHGVHSRRCPVAWEDHVLRSGLSGLFGKLTPVEGGALAGARSVGVGEPHAYVQASIAPGDAKRIGIRIGRQAPVEVVFTGDRLIVDGTSFPFTFRAGQTTLDLSVFAHYNLLTLWANNYFFIEKATTFSKAEEVTVFADGGTATVKSMAVQDVRLDPDNRSPAYACNCAHGAVRRNPIPQ